MARSDENNPDVIGQSINNVQGGIQRGKMVSEIGHNRRALSNINRNLVGVPPYPCAVNKRGLSERQSICDKNPVHRPITRKYAAQMANKQQAPSLPPPQPEETKKPVESEAPSLPPPQPEETKKPVESEAKQPLSESRECRIVDVEEYTSASDLNVPVYVKHTVAMLDEIDQMEEDEMEDLIEESVVDIDSNNSKNPLEVVEYIEDIYAHHRKLEKSSRVSPNYMEQQFDINEKMRGILIDWLIEVHYKFELMDETLFLTVNIIDRFLERQSVLRKKLQLVGVTALLLACKYEEVSVPVVEDLILISDKAYTRKEVLDMEKLMVNTLQFNMSVPTPYVFMRRFLKASESDKKLELLSFFMVELCLVEYEMLNFSPSLLAAAAIYTAQCSLHSYTHWSKTSEWYTTYSEDKLLECSRRMVTFHQNSATGKLTGVHRKYSTYKFGCAAKSEPALFLLETRL